MQLKKEEELLACISWERIFWVRIIPLNASNMIGY